MGTLFWQIRIRGSHIRFQIFTPIVWPYVKSRLERKEGHMPYFKKIGIDLRIKSLQWIIALLALLFSLGCQKQANAGPKAPDFSLPDLSNDSISLQQHRGSIIIIDFWATWCPPCRKSIPELIMLQGKYRPKGLVVLAISVDDPGQVPTSYLQTFKEEFKINYKVLRYNNKVMKDYFGDSRVSIPTQFVIDREGKIIKKIVGFRPGAIEQFLDELFK